jgi:hypothetical protein
MKLATLLLAATVLTPVAANAAEIAALTGDNMLSIVDSETRRQTRTVTIQGADGPIAGIDVRPADGMLYAVSRSGAIYTVDLQSGRVTEKSRIQGMPPANATVTVDFNPMADRLRVIGSDGTNLRINVDNGQVTTDGRLRFAEGTTGQPNVIAGAYTNSTAGATATVLYDIDNQGRFLRQAPPNDGVLTPIGQLGATPSMIAFDIQTNGTENTGWAVADGQLHRVDISTGRATAVGRLEGVQGQVRDIAVLPTRR